jgi:peptidoglycan/xylan/chitin deacetylase (PgdA/CDA1 family)
VSFAEHEGPRREVPPRRGVPARRAASIRARLLAVGALAGVIAAVVAAIAVATGGHKSHASATTASTTSAHRSSSGTTSTAASGTPGTLAVPILMYHVINVPPPSAAFPGLYVPRDEFLAQMQALKAAGWHAVTMDQLEAYWTRGTSLGPGKPVVLSFDNGYASQYNNALPILKSLGWVGVENLQLQGLPPDQGGLTDAQVRGLVAAGWELDTQGINHADLITLGTSDLQYQVATARQMLRSQYGVPANWFCYPSGHYNATVIAEVKAAGFVGSTTVVPGWAGRQQNRYALPRLRVLGGTSPSALLAQISAAQNDPAPGGSYSGASIG